MYKDIKLDKDGYINNVHIMTYEEAYEITGNNNNTSGIRNIDANYWLASANRGVKKFML